MRSRRRRRNGYFRRATETPAVPDRTAGRSQEPAPRPCTQAPPTPPALPRRAPAPATNPGWAVTACVQPDTETLDRVREALKRLP